MIRLTALQDYSIECADIEGGDCKCGINWGDVDARIRSAMWERGLAYEDLCLCVGIDLTKGNVYEQQKKMPRMQAVLKASTFIGVPAAWLLFGQKEKPANISQAVVGTTDSTVIQGNVAETIIVNGNAADRMTEHKKELIRIFDGLSIRNQTKLLSLAYRIEEVESPA